MAKTLKVEIIGEAKGLSRELKSASAETEGFGAKLGAMAGPAAAGAAAIGIGLVTEGLTKSVEAAMAEQEQMAKLGAAFKASGLNVNDYKGRIDEAESSGRKLGFTNEDTIASMAKLIIPTKNVGVATKDLGVAMDLARFKHIDLSSASQILAQAMTGSQRAVKQLGITIPPVTTAEDALKRAHVDTKTAAGAAEMAHAKYVDKLRTGNEIIDAVSQKVKGQSRAYAQTAAGGMAAFSAQIDNLEVKLGNKLLPVLTKVIAFINANFPTIEATVTAVMDAVGTAIDMVKPYIEGLMRVIKGMVELVKGLATGDWSMAWKGIKDIAVGYITAVKALVMIQVKLLVTEVTIAWNALKTVTTPAWNAIKTAVTTAATAAKTAATTAFNAAKTAVTTASNAAKTAATTALNAMKTAVMTAVNALKTAATTAWNGIASAVSGAAGRIKGVINGIASVVRGLAGAFESAWNTISSIVSKIKGAVSDAKSAISSLPGGGLVSSALSHFEQGGLVPRFQHGGLAPGEIPAVLHRGEYVISASAVQAIGAPVLDSLNALTPTRRASAVVGVGAITGGDGTHIHFHGGTFIGGNPAGVARALAPAITRQLNQSSRRVGI